MDTATLYGSALSLYTGRARSYLLKAGIPYRETTPITTHYRDVVVPRAGGRQGVPTLELADGTVIRDGAAIVDHFEQQSANAFSPEGEVQNLISRLFDVIGAEGLLRPAMHYRWNFPDENLDFLIFHFETMTPRVADRRQRAEKAADRMRAAGRSFGALPDTFDFIESSYREVLNLMNQHFAAYPYLLGGRPCIGDFGLIAPANSLTILRWLDDKYPHLIQQANNNSVTIVNKAIYANSLEALQWINDKYPDLIQQINENGLTIAHTAASANSLKILQWLDNMYPHLIEKKAHNGATIAHYAAKANSLTILRWLYDKYPHLIQQVNNNGVTIVNQAAYASSLEALQWINDKYPDLIQQINENGLTIAHAAALANSLKILQWLDNIHPHLIEKKAHNGTTVAHYAAKANSLTILRWLDDKYSHLIRQASNNGVTIVNDAVYANSLEVLQWIDNKYPDLIQQIIENGTTIAHTAALADSLKVLKWLDNVHPHLIKKKAHNGTTVAHFAAKANSLTILRWLDDKYPHLIQQVTNNGETIAYVAVLADSLEILKWIDSLYPDLIKKKARDNTTIAYVAAKKKSLRILQWINTKHPHLIQQVANNGVTIAYNMALAGSLTMLQWVVDKFPHLLEKTTDNGTSIAHCAALAGSLEILQWLNFKHPHLIKQTTNNGRTIAYDAAQVGSLKILQWINDNYPSLISKILDDGFTIAHKAASKGSLEILQWIDHNYPHLLKQKTKEHVTIVHSAVKSSIIITYLITEHPQLTSSLWIKDCKGENPDAKASKVGAKLLPSKILHNLLKQAVLKIISAHDKKALTLISAFKDQTFKIIITPNAFEDNILSKITQSALLEKCLGPIFFSIEPFIEFQSYDVHEKPFTGALLNNLLIYAKKTESSKSRLFWPKSSQFIKTLSQFQRRIRKKGMAEDQPLDSKGITTLLVIIDDHQRSEPNQHTKKIDKMLMQKLLATKTLSDMHQKPQVTAGENIAPENFEKHMALALDDLSGLVDGPMLKDDVKRNATLVFHGIKHIIEHKDKILAHVEATPGVLYFLDENEKLPLHTDHAGFNANSTHGNIQAYELMLEHLVTNFLGAYYTAKRAGYLNDFLEKLSYGYCLEGRIRDTFQWVIVNLSEVKSMDKLMEKYIKDYLAYEEVMNRKSEEELTDLDYATQFIVSRHSGMPCVPHKTYASDGIVTAEGVRKYMEDILSFEPEKKQNCILS